MQKDGLKATFCPILSEVCSEYIFDLETDETRLMKNEKNRCAVCEKCLDKTVKEMSVNKAGKKFLLKNEGLHNVCRYYSNKRKYGYI